MGIIDRGKAAARDAQDRLAAAARAQETRVSGTVGEERYDRARSRLGSAASKSAGAVSSAGHSALDRAGRTSSGKKVGDGARTIVKEIQGIPLVGLTPEMLAARNGVPTLRKRFTEDPADPAHALWLAEAMLRTEREARVVRTASTVTNPGSLLVRGVARTATSLARDPREPAGRRLLRVAFAGAVARVRTNTSDAPSLHVLSRVYLAQGMIADAVRLAMLAAEADPVDGGPLVTAAYAHLRANDLEQAAARAAEGLARGCSVAHEVTAELLRRELRQREDITAKERNDQYATELKKVRRKDRHTYYGAALTAPAVTWAVTAQEARKTATLTRRLVRVTRRRKQ